MQAAREQLQPLYDFVVERCTSPMHVIARA
jgi:hypothetical protein